jgi:hypothetical protein
MAELPFLKKENDVKKKKKRKEVLQEGSLLKPQSPWTS